MTIGNVVERGGFVHVYDEKGVQLSTISVGTRPDDRLVGYTANRVNIRMGGFIYSYDERGRVVTTTSAR